MELTYSTRVPGRDSLVRRRKQRGWTKLARPDRGASSALGANHTLFESPCIQTRCGQRKPRPWTPLSAISLWFWHDGIYDSPKRTEMECIDRSDCRCRGTFCGRFLPPYSDETILPLLETLTNKSDHGDILFGTQHGLGVCHEYTSPGDYVFLLDGVNQPLVLRPLKRAGYSSEQGTHSEYCRFRILSVCWWQRPPSWSRLEEETNAAEGADKPASHFRHEIIEVY